MTSRACSRVRHATVFVHGGTVFRLTVAANYVHLQVTSMTDEDPVCCGASRDTGSTVRRDETEAAASQDDGPTVDRTDDRTERMVRLDGGTFTMGTDDDMGFPADGEGPAREVTLDPFFVDKYSVTNAEFLAFVRETGYTTDAERFGWSFVFQDFLTDEARDYVIQNVDAAPWWLAVEGATGFRPYVRTSSRKTFETSRNPRLMARRRCVRRVGGEAPPHRGRVGVRRPWRPRR